MRKKVCLLSLAVLSLSTLWFTGRGVAGAPQRPIPMRAEFVDGQGYRVEGDGEGDYVDGEGKVKCQIDPKDGHFHLNTYYSVNPPRYLRCHLDAPATTTCLPPQPEMGTITGFDLQVRGNGNLLTMDVDSPVTMDAFVGTYVGNLHLEPWAEARYFGSSCSGQVQVTRTSLTTWEISPVISSPPADVAVLIQTPVGTGSRPTRTRAGYFHLPFKMTITTQ